MIHFANRIQSSQFNFNRSRLFIGLFGLCFLLASPIDLARAQDFENQAQAPIQSAAVPSLGRWVAPTSDQKSGSILSVFINDLLRSVQLGDLSAFDEMDAFDNGGGVVPFDDRYRIGSEWGKLPVTEEMVNTGSPAFQRAVRATARVGGATGFYLGRFAGFHVMATNHHVFPEAFRCLGQKIRFPLLGVEGTCQKFLGTWTDIDLSLFVLKISSEGDAAKLATVAQNFDFQAVFEPEIPLMTAGFGVANNGARRLVVNQDADCKVFSKQNEYRFMADPDAFNPGPYRAWSFSNGCDVSHGDSGSAMVHRLTGRVLGLIWTGKIPKDAQVQNSENLRQILNSQSELLWTELSYAVPAPKIQEVLNQQLESGAIQDGESQQIIRELIQ